MVNTDIDGENVDIVANEEEQPLLEEDSPGMANLPPMSDVEKDLAKVTKRSNSLRPSVSHNSDVQVGIENLSKSTPPHESYEGVHRWDPTATWTPEEEAAVVRKTDIYLLSWVCLMVRGPAYLREPDSNDNFAAVLWSTARSRQLAERPNRQPTQGSQDNLE